MDDFKVIIDSLGNYTLGALMSADVELVRVWSDEVDRSAHMEICLRDDDWDSRAKAIKAMAEVREIFIDDLALDYVFGASCAGSGQTADSRSAVFAA
ncbi:hypothetical protein [Cellulomonas carbonis]|uniref:Uncharacterized protein n=1 Tax=Cellulomonas carbonis T26 TaxID=947969 RepID=A0A0A0BWV3_9CELL|nr:hypothetical protein [Cellulomonas carbonis]KGM11639.1 hypothetical protein N868_08165 [Cellulomonas carbonis T26]GGC03163.1 hypothetical protein GCM10010972_15280 [Cellulomonas carbonis]